MAEPMTDREFVEQHWERGEYEQDQGIFLGGRFMYWSAAAEFTRERLEEIRQLQHEIDENCEVYGVEPWECIGWNSLDCGAEWARSQCSGLRTRARLEAALADLQRGMKEQS